MDDETDLIRDIPSLGALVDVCQVSPDDYANVRYVHETAVRLLSGDMMTTEDLSEWSAYVRHPSYTEALFRTTTYAAWLHSEMVATISWQPASDKPDTAKINSLFVRPLFANAGIGSRLLETVETQAAVSGYHATTIRAFQTATGFFQSKGYRISSYGIRVVSPKLSFPVTYMRKGDATPRVSDHNNHHRQKPAPAR